MNNNFEKSFSGKTGDIYLPSFEEILNKAKVIIFSKNRIEIPGIIIFAREGKCLINQLFNPGVEILSVANLDFDKMLQSLEIEEENLMFFKLSLKQGGVVRINLNKIKEGMILVRKTEDILVINNILFTSNEAEFHGTGMFTLKELSFLLSKEDIKRIYNYIFS